MSNQENTKPKGNLIHAHFSSASVDKRLRRFKMNGGRDITLFKLYRTQEDPSRIVPASYLSGGVNPLDRTDQPMGLVYDSPFAEVKTTQALALFGQNAKEIFVKIQEIKDENELLGYLKLQ